MSVDSIYQNGHYYDLQFENSLEDVPFYSHLIQSRPGTILDLGCGTGRLTIPLAKLGQPITGLDLMPSMLELAAEKAKKAGVSINWREGNMTSFELNERFDWIFLPFNSIQHLHTSSDLTALFACVRKHLNNDGQFVFDTDKSEYTSLSNEFTTAKVVAKFDDPNGLGNVRIECRHAYDRSNQMLKHELSQFLNNQLVKKDHLDLKCFKEFQLEQILEASGFKVVEKFGSFKREPLLQDSRSMIFLCKTIT